MASPTVGTMQNAILLPMLVTLLVGVVAAITDNTFSPFSPPNLIEPPSIDNSTILPSHHADLELRKAIDTCNTCSNLNAASVCCTSNGICTYDWAGHVACCWAGTSCTGTLSGGTTGTSTTNTLSLTNVASTVTESPTSSTLTTPAVTATTANGIVIVQGNGGSASGATSIQKDSVAGKLLAVLISMMCSIAGCFLGL